MTFGIGLGGLFFQALMQLITQRALQVTSACISRHLHCFKSQSFKATKNTNALV